VLGLYRLKLNEFGRLLLLETGTQITANKSLGKSRKRPIIGIIGGICSGKSSVAQEFGRHGCKVIDADEIGHQLLFRPAVKKEVLAKFGDGILDTNNSINRRRLAETAFADAEKLAALNNIIHPHILKAARRLIKKYSRQSSTEAIVLDMPLLVEVGWHKYCDNVLFVECDRQIRKKRMKTTGITNKKYLSLRENFQIPLDTKQKLADTVIYNNSDFPALTRQVSEFFSATIKG